MSFTLIAILGVLSIVVVTSFSKRLGLAAPLALVVVGIVVSYVPGTPDIELDPELILAGVLPPLLYSSAVEMPSQDFRRNLKAISGLAVVLVVLSTLGVGALFHTVMSGVSWPAAFALGAVISPTDAVAATSIGRKLGLPPRVVTMLEGEGLVNDASSLVLLRSAVAAIASSVSLWSVAGNFVRSVVIAVAVGAAVGVVMVRVRALLRDPVLSTAMSFAVPFISFLPAEELEASGVLAVVVTGLVVGREGPRRIAARDRWVESMNWRTIAFLLESAIFLVMGIDLKPLVDSVRADGYNVWHTVLLGVVAAVAVALLRLLFVVPLFAMLRQDQRNAADVRPKLDQWQDHPRFEKLDQMSDRRRERIAERVERMSADLDFKLNEAVGWRSAVVLGWAGMRGAITVAAALTLPFDTPRRPELVLIAYLVAVITLFGQGLTLPAVIRAANVPDKTTERVNREQRELIQDLYEIGIDEVERLAQALTEPGEKATLTRVRDDLVTERDSLHRRADLDARSEVEDYCRMRLDVVAAQRVALNDFEDRGTFSSQSIRTALGMLDRDEVRLTSVEIGAD